MKILLSLYIYLYSLNCHGQAGQMIILTHIGESDKPIPTIVAYTKNGLSAKLKDSIFNIANRGFMEKIVIDSNDFKSMFNKTKHLNSTKPDKVLYELGAFQINFYDDNCSTHQFFIYQKEESISFFLKVIETIKEESGTLTIALQRLRKRLDF